MAQPELALVGDVGATNMRLGVASAEGLLESKTVPTPSDPDEFFRRIGDTTRAFMADYDIAVGAIGFPGPVKVTANGIKVGPITNIAALDEVFDVNERVAAESKLLNGFSILALNDAEAATHAAPDMLADSEDRDGVVTYITHSTGVGGESIHAGVICSRADGMLAEYGHIPLMQADGQYETLENLISGNSIAMRYGKGLYKSMSPRAIEHWNRIGRNFGRGIATLAPIVGMTAVVIGGGVSRSHARYQTALKDELAKAVSSIPNGVVNEPPRIKFVPARLIDDIGLHGAFQAIRQRHEELA